MYLSKNTQLKYFFSIVVIIWFFNVAYTPNISFIVGVIAAVVYIYYDVNSNDTLVQDENLELDFKLNSILAEEGKQPPDFFYTEPDLINFFYGIKEYRVYNRDSYIKAIKCANNLLKLRTELENDFHYTENQEFDSWQNFGYTKKNIKKTNIKNLKEINEIAKTFSVKSLNYLHTFAVSLPSQFKNKIQTSLDRYHILMKRITDDIYFHCKKYSKNPLITQDYGLPKPFVKVSNFDFFV